MAIGLPSMVHGDGITKRTQVHFGGYNHNKHAGDGQIYDMQNLTSDDYPLLSPRKERHTLYETFDKLNGVYVRDGKIFILNGTDFFEYSQNFGGTMHAKPDTCEGVNFEDSRKTFVALGDNVIILPDKLCWNTKDGTIKNLEATWTGSATIKKGKYAGKDAAANTIYAEGADWEGNFKVGDAVEISGCKKHTANNKIIIIREIEGDYLRFYENSFTIAEGGDTETEITIKRTMPEMDFMCENENRLWGCKGSTIYASKLGDPFNWNVFDGISTDSYAADVGSAGDFTACCSFLGYPCFFKEEHIYKVYGDRPANFQVMGSASLGVAAGSSKSLAIAGEILFYLSRIGIVAYTGGMPQSVSEPLGAVRYKNAVGGSDGIKYYVSMADEEGAYYLFVYDTQKNLWHKEDETKATSFLWSDRRLFWTKEDGGVWYYGEAIPAPTQMKETVESFAEFGDFTDGDPNKKGTGKLQLRLELSEGASVTVKLQFDSDGTWQEVKTLDAEKKRSFYLPIIPRRADHFRVRIEGTGQWWLHSMVRESYSGSEV